MNLSPCFPDLAHSFKPHVLRHTPTDMTKIPSLLIVVLGILISSGCTSTVAEEDHAEHHTPAHRPRDLQAAVDQVRTRWPSGRSSTSTTDGDTSRAELGDIIRWLPEIAGESRLGRSEWDTVHRIAIELEAIHEREGQSGKPAPQDESRRQHLIDELDRIAPLATDSIHGASR